MISAVLGFNIYAVTSQNQIEENNDFSLCKKLVKYAVKEKNLTEKVMQQLIDEDKKYSNLSQFDHHYSYSINYYCVRNKKIICIFSHNYLNKKFSTILLSGAYTNPTFRKLGYGTLLYNYIVKDIFEHLNINHILAQAVTNSGKNLLKNFDFRIDKDAIQATYCDLIMYNPKIKKEHIPATYILLKDYLKTNKTELKKDVDENITNVL